MAKDPISESTRRNLNIVMRSVLNSVSPAEEGERGEMLDRKPSYPKLPKVGKRVLHVPLKEDVDAVLNEGRDGSKVRYCSKANLKRSQLAFALAAWAGLRASEVRALRSKDICRATRTITVRAARCADEESTPKSGHERTTSISNKLWERLDVIDVSMAVPEGVLEFSAAEQAALAHGEAIQLTVPDDDEPEEPAPTPDAPEPVTPPDAPAGQPAPSADDDSWWRDL
jgi:hypothetical protein